MFANKVQYYYTNHPNCCKVLFINSSLWLTWICWSCWSFLNALPYFVVIMFIIFPRSDVWWLCFHPWFEVPAHDNPTAYRPWNCFQQDGFKLPLQNTHNQLEGKTKVNVFVCFIWVHRTKIMIMLGVLSSGEDWVLRWPPGPEEKHVVFDNSQQELEDREEFLVLVRSLSSVTRTTKRIKCQEASHFCHYIIF